MNNKLYFQVFYLKQKINEKNCYVLTFLEITHDDIQDILGVLKSKFDCDIQDILGVFNTKYGTEIKELKQLQLETLSPFGNLSSDVICMLPTGNRKSLIYKLLPVLLGKKINKSA